MKNNTITLEMVSQWVGSNFTRDDFIKLLTELANEEYLASHFANDILAIELEDNTYDEYGVNTKNTFNTAPNA